MKYLKVKLTFTEEVLGTASNNKEIHHEFIASKAPDAPKREQEIEAIGVDEYEEKQMTVFPRNADGNPLFWDYQIKGFFKDTCQGLQRMKGEEMAKESCAIKAYKKTIDKAIFVYPREIPISLSGEITECQRPLRASTAQGERIALASSEAIPAGSTVEFWIETPDKYEKAIIEWLDYGRRGGIGQWRNSGKGRFRWELIKEGTAKEALEA